MYETVTGRGDIVIPTSVTGSSNAACDGRGESLAQMPQTRLQLVSVAAQDKAKIEDALRVVGLDVASSELEVTKKRGR